MFGFLVAFSLIGWFVEYSNWGSKPVQDDEDEDEMWENESWASSLINHGIQNEGEPLSYEQQLAREKEIKLIKSKTLWGLIFLSFSLPRNCKKLFKMTVL